MKFNSSIKIIIAVCILSLVVILIVIGVIWPTANNIRKTTEETYQLRAYMEQRYQESLRSKVTKKKLEDIKQETLGFESAIFKKSQTLDLIKMLEVIASDSGVSQRIEETNLDNINTNQNINLKLSANGKYNDIFKYIYNLETLDYFVNITNLRLTPNYDKNGQSNSSLSASLNIEIYVGQ